MVSQFARSPCHYRIGALQAGYYVPVELPVCRGRFNIGYLISEGQLQGRVEIACQTESTQVLTTIGWAGRIDDVSRQLLIDALRDAVDEWLPVRIHVFAAAARDLFKHTSHTLAPNPKSHSRRRAAYPARRGLSDPFIAKADPLRGDLLAAIDDLIKGARLRPRAIVTDRATVRFVDEALSGLRGLYALFGSYLEQALQPLEPHVSQDTVRAFVLETRGEVDELATCHTVGDVYVETLTITQPGDYSVNLEVEATLGLAAPGSSAADVTSQRW